MLLHVRDVSFFICYWVQMMKNWINAFYNGKSFSFVWETDTVASLEKDHTAWPTMVMLYTTSWGMNYFHLTNTPDVTLQDAHWWELRKEYFHDPIQTKGTAPMRKHYMHTTQYYTLLIRECFKTGSMSLIQWLSFSIHTIQICTQLNRSEQTQILPKIYLWTSNLLSYTKHQEVYSSH
jgi:hypothetical protein